MASARGFGQTGAALCCGAEAWGNAVTLPRRDYAPEAKCPLDGLRVLDLSRLVAGNIVTHMLADFGAEVVKVEPPGQGDTLRHWLEDGVPLYWKIYARNKRSITLDIRTPEGRAALLKLVATAQVLVESMRPGVLERLGLGPDVLHAANPGLVICRVTGWGQTGPYRSQPGFGSLVEGMCGFAAKNGFADKPPALPNMALADSVAGLAGAHAVMVALREVEVKGGKGQVIDLSLLEPLLSILGPDVAEYRVTGQVKPRSGNRASITAPRNVYQAKDGRWLALSASTQGMCERLFKAIGREELLADPRFATNAARLANVEAVDAVVGGFIASMDGAEALAFFRAQEVTVGPVYDASEVEHDEHVAARGVMVDVTDADIGALPMHAPFPRLSATPGEIRTPAPAMGADNDALLGEIGYAAAEIAAMREKGII